MTVRGVTTFHRAGLVRRTHAKQRGRALTGMTSRDTTTNFEADTTREVSA